MPPLVIKGSPISLDLGEAGGGQLLVGNNANDNKVFLQALSTDGQANAAELLITGRFITSLPLVSLLAEITRIVGHLQIGEGFGPAFTISPSDASPNAGFIRFGDSTGWKLHVGRSREASAGPLNTGTTGVLLTIEDSGRIVVKRDIVMAGADCAEAFDVRDPRALDPGTVLVIGDNERLRESCDAYDKRVAGVISGAGDCRPGIVLGNDEHSRRDRAPVALMGKVYCKVDAQYAPLAVGDLLVTSPTPGHAMKARDPLKAFGAGLGKALRPLAEGQGLIPILVSLH
jgi:hypothetical protein